MSCWRNYTCDVLKSVDRSMLVNALKEMGLDLNTSINHIDSRWGEGNVDVDGVLVQNGKNLDLGIVFSDETGHAHVAGDFWGTGLDSTTFTDTLSQIYQKINILAQIELSGYTIDEVETNAEGEIEIEAYAFA